MNQTFNTGCQFHKNTVIGQIDNLASYNRVHRIGFRYFFPGICRQLLQAQRYPFLLRIKGKNFGRNFIAFLKHFRRLDNSPPRNIGHVQQSVNTAQIDENTVIRNILDDPFNNVAFLDVFQNILLFRFSFRSHNGASGQNHIVALSVELQHFKIQRLTYEFIQILYRTDIHLRSWKKSDNADING